MSTMVIMYIPRNEMLGPNRVTHTVNLYSLCRVLHLPTRLNTDIRQNAVLLHTIMMMMLRLNFWKSFVLFLVVNISEERYVAKKKTIRN